MFDLHTKELVYLSHSTFYVMSNCKDGGRRRTQNVGENDLRSTLRSYRKGGLYLLGKGSRRPGTVLRTPKPYLKGEVCASCVI